jgi:hypothetical protein
MFSSMAFAADSFTAPAISLGLLLVIGMAMVIGLHGWRELHELRVLREAQHQARLANENVRCGLKMMAVIVPGLREAQLVLSARAIDLLDTQASLLMALRRVNKKKAAGRRPRARRLIARKLHEITELDRHYGRFEKAVLMAVCEQAACRVVMPPLGTSKYRAVFTVLDHQLPGMLWPTMNRILAQQVQLWVRDACGAWTPARRTGIRCGREFVFSRKNLERATELCLVVADKVVSEFTVEHERAPARPRILWGRWSKSPASSTGPHRL